MPKKINRFITGSIILSIVFALIGGCMIFYSEVSLNVIAYTISAFFIALGIYLLVIDYKTIFLIDTMYFGALITLLGIILLIYPESLSILIPIVLGVWFIMFSLFKIRISLALKDYEDTPWVLSLLLSIVSLICGVLFIINPLTSASVITSAVGIVIIIYAVSNIIDMIILKKNINDIVKALKAHFTILSK